MAGSLKYFKYTTDMGQVFGLLADESNVEAVHVDGELGTGDAGIDLGDEDEIPYSVPRNVRVRVARFRGGTTGAIRKVPLMSREVLDALLANDDTGANRTFTEDGETFGFIGATPERVRAIIGADTGQTDGDN